MVKLSKDFDDAKLFMLYSNRVIFLVGVTLAWDT